jgi:hypothetical protein
MTVWLELTKADSIDGDDQRTYINFDLVVEIDWIASRKVTVLFFGPGYRIEVKEEPESILRSIEGGVR